MRRYHIIIFCLVCVLFSCKKEEIVTYPDCTSERFVKFASPKTESDSLDVSFFSYPGQTTIDYPLVVQATGFSDKDAAYKITVLEEFTTADASDFELPTGTVIKGGQIKDTCYIRFNYSEKLDETQVRIVVELQPTDDFALGQTESRVAIIWLHNNAKRPDWWTTNVNSYILGPYTAEKYQAFMKFIKVDVSNVDNSTLRYYALLFKQYLAEQKALGKPILEANGTEMTVLAI